MDLTFLLILAIQPARNTKKLNKQAKMRTFQWGNEKTETQRQHAEHARASQGADLRRKKPLNRVSEGCGGGVEGVWKKCCNFAPPPSGPKLTQIPTLLAIFAQILTLRDTFRMFCFYSNPYVTRHLLCFYKFFTKSLRYAALLLKSLRHATTFNR